MINHRFTKATSLLLILVFISSLYPLSDSSKLTAIVIQPIDILFLNSETSNRFEGYNLFVVERRTSAGWIIVNRTMLITDLDGNIYFEREISGSGGLADHAAEFINSTTILYSELGLTRLWNIETNVTTDFSFAGHHDTERNYANDTYFVLKGEVIEIDGEDYLYDKIHEYSPEGDLVWEFNTLDIVNESYWCPFEDMESSFRDLTHSNSAYYDEAEDVIYLNSRNLNTFFKIDHKTGGVIWALGEYGNFTLYDFYGNQQEIMFYHTHSLEKIGDNKFLVFDNDTHNQTNANNLHSRLLEITIDENKMQANVSWEWISSIDYFSGWWGDCDILPNNNVLGVFGTTGHPNTELGARLVEVNRSQEITWEFSFPKADDEVFGVYKIERIRFAPIVSTPRFIEEVNSSYLEWDVWYNFRSKTNFTGSYFIDIDGVTVETGQLDFPRYWQSTQVQYEVDEITAGTHNISLIVADEAGHLSNESDRFSSTGTFTFKGIAKKSLKLGLSIGIPSSTLLIAFVVLFIFLNKKGYLKKKRA
ncbi:MAG: hypothetical protein HeimAB125_19650 [Candidatus Heimdallarchaeota archaeon AB_125]|nr:MAG: hypothetical protein HeimAB125_19650 [Candidatus Heimdallarchaeota archaeon AB_125]